MTARTLLLVVPTLAMGGAERHAVYVASALPRRRWRPHVLAFADGPLRAELDAAGVPTSICPLRPGPHTVPDAARAVYASVLELRPDLVSGHHILVEMAVRLALRRSPTPFLSWKHTYGNVGHRQLRERLFERATGRAVTRYGAVCHTQVRFLTDELGLPPEKISVVPNSVPVPSVRPQPPAHGVPSVLMVAAMRADKDHDLVLRSWRSVLEEQPSAQLLFAGDGPYRDRLEKTAARLGIAHGVRFLGVRADISDLLEAASLLVLASYSVECFPYAVLEAMAAGRGVVSTNIAGLPELVDDGVTGRLVPPRDPAALTSALLEGLTSRTTAAAWGAAGWERVQRTFPFDGWADRVTWLLDRVAASPPVVQLMKQGESLS